MNLYNYYYKDTSNLRRLKVNKYGAKAGYILTSGLYKDPFGSAIRETLTNAYDAMIYANKNPNDIEVDYDAFEDKLIIKDFGIGLTDNEVKQLFTTFFASTKEDDAKVVGRFGLGAKSPFAYTDSFMIESRKDGFKTRYVATNNSGFFRLVKLKVDATSEPDGVTVEIPVMNGCSIQDLAEIIAKTCYALGFCPKILNKDLAKDVYAYYSELIISALDERNFGDTRVIIGDIFWSDQKAVYVISGNTLVETYHYRSYTGSMVIIGDFKVTPSRESIQNVSEIIDEVSRQLTDFKELKALYYRCCNISTLTEEVVNDYKLLCQKVSELTGYEIKPFSHKAQTLFKKIDHTDFVKTPSKLNLLERESVIPKNTYAIGYNQEKHLIFYNKDRLLELLDHSIDVLKSGYLQDGILVTPYHGVTYHLKSYEILLTVSPKCLNDEECMKKVEEWISVCKSVQYQVISKPIYDILDDKRWYIPARDDNNVIVVDVDQIMACI